MRLTEKQLSKIPWKPVPVDYKLEPGHLVKFKDGSINICGDFNILGGSCDCCVCITLHDIVEYSTIQELIDKVGTDHWEIYRMKFEKDKK